MDFALFEVFFFLKMEVDWLASKRAIERSALVREISGLFRKKVALKLHRFIFFLAEEESEPQVERF